MDYNLRFGKVLVFFYCMYFLIFVLDVEDLEVGGNFLMYYFFFVNNV